MEGPSGQMAHGRFHPMIAPLSPDSAHSPESQEHPHPYGSGSHPPLPELFFLPGGCSAPSQGHCPPPQALSHGCPHAVVWPRLSPSPSSPSPGTRLAQRLQGDHVGLRLLWEGPAPGWGPGCHVVPQSPLHLFRRHWVVSCLWHSRGLVVRFGPESPPMPRCKPLPAG